MAKPVAFGTKHLGFDGLPGVLKFLSLESTKVSAILKMTRDT